VTNTDSPTAPRKLKPRLIEPPPAETIPAVVEAVLFVADQPIVIADLARSVGLTRAQALAALDALAASLQGHGVCVQRTGELVQLASAPDASPYVQQFLGLEHPRLTNASLETLALIAYRQPITRPDIEAVRGVDCDAPIRTLLARELIEEVGRAHAVGRPVLFGTTVRFLEYFGLEKPDDLPPLPFAQDEPEEAAI